MNSNFCCRKESKNEKSGPSVGSPSTLSDRCFVVVDIITITLKEGEIYCVQDSTSVPLEPNSMPMQDYKMSMSLTLLLILNKSVTRKIIKLFSIILVHISEAKITFPFHLISFVSFLSIFHILSLLWFFIFIHFMPVLSVFKQLHT